MVPVQIPADHADGESLSCTILYAFTTISQHRTSSYRIGRRLLLTNLTVLTIKNSLIHPTYSSILSRRRLETQSLLVAPCLSPSSFLSPVQRRACARVHNLAGILFRCSGVRDSVTARIECGLLLSFIMVTRQDGWKHVFRGGSQGKELPRSGLAGCHGG